MATLRDAFTANIAAVQAKINALPQELADRTASLNAELAAVTQLRDSFPATFLDTEASAARQIAQAVVNRLS